MKRKGRSPILKIATTHLLSRKRQTIVSMLGVTFGITVFVFQAGLVTGLQSFFIDQTINSTAHIHLFNEPGKLNPVILKNYKETENDWVVLRNQKPKDESPKIRNGLQVVNLLETMKEVEGVSPLLSSQVIFKLGLADESGFVAGVNIRKEERLFHISENQAEGDVMKLETVNNGIILGKGLARKLGAKMGDNLRIISPFGVALEMKVVGINQTGLTSVDNSRAFISLRNAQKLMLVEGSFITDINIRLRDISNAERLADEFEKKFNLKGEDWKEANASVFSIFKIQKMVTFLVIFSILVVSGFGIFNILNMMIYEKLPDIAILKAIGYTDRDIRSIFQVEALTIGFFGGLIGLLLGYFISLFISTLEVDIQGFISVQHMVINFDPVFYIIAFCFGLISTSLAGYFPARRASRVDPIDIIRGK